MKWIFINKNPSAIIEFYRLGEKEKGEGYKEIFPPYILNKIGDGKEISIADARKKAAEMIKDLEKLLKEKLEEVFLSKKKGEGSYGYFRAMLLPYVCIKATNGGGWYYVGKIKDKILYVPKGTEGLFIGKGGENVKKLNLPYRITVKGI